MSCQPCFLQRWGLLSAWTPVLVIFALVFPNMFKSKKQKHRNFCQYLPFSQKPVDLKLFNWLWYHCVVEHFSVFLLLILSVTLFVVLKIFWSKTWSFSLIKKGRKRHLFLQSHEHRLIRLPCKVGWVWDEMLSASVPRVELRVAHQVSKTSVWVPGHNLGITSVSSGGLRVTPGWYLFTSSSSTQYHLPPSSADPQLWPLLLPARGQESRSGRLSSTCCLRPTRLSSHSLLPSQRRNSCALVVLKAAPLLSSLSKHSSHLPLGPELVSFLSPLLFSLLLTSKSVSQLTWAHDLKHHLYSIPWSLDEARTTSPEVRILIPLGGCFTDLQTQSPNLAPPPNTLCLLISENHSTIYPPALGKTSRTQEPPRNTKPLRTQVIWTLPAESTWNVLTSHHLRNLAQNFLAQANTISCLDDFPKLITRLPFIPASNLFSIKRPEQFS